MQVGPGILIFKYTKLSAVEICRCLSQTVLFSLAMGVDWILKITSNIYTQAEVNSLFAGQKKCHQLLMAYCEAPIRFFIWLKPKTESCSIIQLPQLVNSIDKNIY